MDGENFPNTKLSLLIDSVAIRICIAHHQAPDISNQSSAKQKKSKQAPAGNGPVNMAARSLACSTRNSFDYSFLHSNKHRQQKCSHEKITSTGSRRMACNRSSAFASGPELPHIILSDMADKYGPIFSIRLGVHSALIMSSWEIAKECFTTNYLIFCDRTRTTAIKHMSYDFAMFGLGKYGPYWRELRKISVQKLLPNRKIEMLRHLYVAEIRALMRYLYNACVESTTRRRRRWR
ncbi:UNVERIFIED_CONTAM: cytochrome [Sesamum calycinum]|uniref:Cytochrome n=1 Tax=Sesamum calycinum TaxID=2727403 RepID=A0AAW2PAF2_9LAMI